VTKLASTFTEKCVIRTLLILNCDTNDPHNMPLKKIVSAYSVMIDAEVGERAVQKTLACHIKVQNDDESVAEKNADDTYTLDWHVLEAYYKYVISFLDAFDTLLHNKRESSISLNDPHVKVAWSQYVFRPLGLSTPAYVSSVEMIDVLTKLLKQPPYDRRYRITLGDDGGTYLGRRNGVESESKQFSEEDVRRPKLVDYNSPIVKAFFEKYDDSETTMDDVEMWLCEVTPLERGPWTSSSSCAKTLLDTWGTPIAYDKSRTPDFSIGRDDEFDQYSHDKIYYVLDGGTGIYGSIAHKQQNDWHAAEAARELRQSSGDRFMSRRQEDAQKKGAGVEQHPDVPHGGMLHPREKKYVPELEIESNVSLLKRFILNVLNELKK
jgi:hypothetical protein